MSRDTIPITLPAEALQFDAQGRPRSARYADVYASGDGALGQARHVFLAGNDLPRAWVGRRHYTIVETGFGLGNNFLATWQAWRADPARPRRLHYYSLEKHPLQRADLRAGSATRLDDPLDAAADALRGSLVERWPDPVIGLHRLDFDGGAVALTLVLGDAQHMIPELQLGADAFYLDGFAPDRNPELWTPLLLRALARLARPGATLATYTSARAVRDALASHGFECRLAPGYGHKRDMLRGCYAPRWRMRRHEPAAAYGGTRQALVVGAGLAGCACAAALAGRGWQVQLLDRAGIAAGASGLPAGLLVPLLSADDNLTSRLVRAGWRYSLAVLRALAPPATSAEPAPLWTPCGVFEQATDEQHEAQLRAMLAEQRWPPSLALYCTAAEAAARLGRTPRRGGVWFAQGGLVSAARWCEALARVAPGSGDAARIVPRDDPATGRILADTSFDVAAIRSVDGDWEAADRRGRRHRAPVLVLANAAGLATLQDLRGTPLQQIGGRLSLLQAPALADLACAIGGDGYAIPPLLGRAAIGATYEFSPFDADVPGRADGEAAAHQSNLERLTRLLAQPPAVQVSGTFAAQRCVAPDRLPLAGPMVDELAVADAAVRLRGARGADLPRLPGLYCLTALGSRGLSLAPLLGELVAAQVCGEPVPIEATLAAAVDPARYTLRRLR